MELIWRGLFVSAMVKSNGGVCCQTGGSFRAGSLGVIKDWSWQVFLTSLQVLLVLSSLIRPLLAHLTAFLHVASIYLHLSKEPVCGFSDMHAILDIPMAGAYACKNEHFLERVMSHATATPGRDLNMAYIYWTHLNINS